MPSILFIMDKGEDNPFGNLEFILSELNNNLMFVSISYFWPQSSKKYHY